MPRPPRRLSKHWLPLKLVTRVGCVFHGKHDVIRLAQAALLAHGHILFEDVPGAGEIQFPRNLLPSGVLAASVYNPRSAESEVRPGPTSTNFALVDEIRVHQPRRRASHAGGRPLRPRLHGGRVQPAETRAYYRLLHLLKLCRHAGLVEVRKIGPLELVESLETRSHPATRPARRLLKLHNFAPPPGAIPWTSASAAR